MLRRGIADRCWTSSNTRCGVFAAMKAKSAPARTSSSTPVGKIIGQLVKTPCIEQGDALIDVEAVDDYVRISPIRPPGAIARNDGAIVVDSGLRPKPADHPYGSHITGKRCMPGGVGFDWKQSRQVLPTFHGGPTRFPPKDNIRQLQLWRASTVSINRLIAISN